MSDHSNDDEEPEGVQIPRFILPFIQPPTPEQIDQHNMAMSASQHDFYRLFNELDMNQLGGLQKMLHVINCHDGSVGEHLEGIALGILNAKFNICLACGVDHDQEIHSMVGTEEVTDE